MTQTDHTSDHEDTRVDRVERWFRNQPLTSVLIIVGICVIGVSEVAQHGTDLLTRVGILKETTLQLSTQNAKGELSRKLVALASRRIYWTRNYYTRLELGRSPEELDYSWNKQLEAVADWSTDLITNINTIREYYPHSDKLAQFNHIHDEFTALENDLVNLRNLDEDLRNPHPTEFIKQHKDQIKALIPKVKNSTDQVNFDLYMFALNESGERPTSKTSVISQPTSEVTGSTERNETPTAQDSKPPSCAIAITYPKPGTSVGSAGLFKGTAQIPSSSHLWVFVHKRALNVWWPQGGGTGETPINNGQWVEIEVFYGNDGDIGEDFEVAAAAVGDDADKQLKNWIATARDRNYAPIQFPDTIPGCPVARVRFTQERSARNE